MVRLWLVTLQEWLVCQLDMIGNGDLNPLLPHCRIIDLPKVHEPRGNLTYVEESQQAPFDIARVYYLYDVPGGAERGAHAHKELRQLIIAVAGSFDVGLSDGLDKKTFHLNRPYQALLVCPMIWRDLSNFSSGSVCLVLASNCYDEDDYFRNFDAYMAARREGLYYDGSK